MAIEATCAHMTRHSI